MSNTATATPTLFVWDNNYENREQVRPYMEDFLRVREEIMTSGFYTDNSRYVGRIPGLAGSKDESTGIYLLQNLYRLDVLQENIDQAIADGATPIDRDAWGSTVRKGTLYRYGWFMGGTGWEVQQNVRVTTLSGRVAFKQPRQRNWRTYFDGSKYLFNETK